MKNETTSKRVSKIAGKWLTALNYDAEKGAKTLILVSELKALAASCLTQAPDKPKAKK